ncbi:hypothetical protein C8F01DRAFT_1257171 [Mycena amicta]|nr:hypothetical protein C8F01DRAFT_1257171 [Mycena amicta]
MATAYIAPEVLCHTLSYLGIVSLVAASGVCSHWRAAAIADTGLWLDLDIISSDVIPQRVQVVADMLTRSKDRPIRLNIRLVDELCVGHWVAQYPDKAQQLFQNIIAPHLQRCKSLTIAADQEVWFEILHGAYTPVLPWSTSQLPCENNSAWYLWQVAIEYEFGDEDDGECPEPLPLTFLIPDDNCLEDVTLIGLSLGSVPLPHLRRLDVRHHLPDFAISDTALNTSLLNSPKELILNGLCVPALDDTGATHVWNTSNVEHLQLISLSSMPVEDSVDWQEYDSVPFFKALDTSAVHTLLIESWEPESAIWEDLLNSLEPPILPNGTIGCPIVKFPLVKDLQIEHIDPLVNHSSGYESLELFFTSFPLLERFKIILNMSFAIWEKVIELFELKPTLCENLRQIEVGGIMIELKPSLCGNLRYVEGESKVIPRDDPLPFRNFMMSSPNRLATLWY